MTRKLFYFFLVFLFVVSLSACGQSGRLYLPDSVTKNVGSLEDDDNAAVQPP